MGNLLANMKFPLFPKAYEILWVNDGWCLLASLCYAAYIIIMRFERDDEEEDDVGWEGTHKEIVKCICKVPRNLLKACEANWKEFFLFFFSEWKFYLFSWVGVVWVTTPLQISYQCL